MRRYTYQVTVAAPQIAYQAPLLKPLALRPEEQPPVYRGHLRAGYGWPNAILGELSYHLIDDAPGQLFISGHHNSANDKKTPLKQFSSSGGTVQGGYTVAPELSIDGSVAYDIDKIFYYGLDPDDTQLYVDESRKYKTFGFRSQLENTAPLNGNVNYRGTFDLYNLQDDLGVKETGSVIGFRGEKIFGDRHVLSLTGGLTLTSMKDTEEKRGQHHAFITPAFGYHADAFAINIGARLAGQKGDFFVFPDASILVRIAGSALSAFVKAAGGITTNSFETLRTTNPYVHQRIESALVNTVHRDYSAGIQGRIGKLEYLGEVGMTSFDSMVLFEPDFFDYRKFQPYYDNGKLYKIEGSVKTELLTNLDLMASVSKIFYDLDTEDKAWYHPGFEAAVTAGLTSLDQKLRISGSLIAASGVPYQNEFGEADKLKSLFNLSAGVDYYIIENVGAFIKINNILGNKYEPWQRYSSFGLNGVVGILVRI
jgi:hypothetical protein